MFNVDNIPKNFRVKEESDQDDDAEIVPRKPDMSKMASERVAKMERFRLSK